MQCNAIYRSYVTTAARELTDNNCCGRPTASALINDVESLGQSYSSAECSVQTEQG